MTVCRGCGADLVERNRELFDADGEPHAPNCPVGGKGVSREQRRRYCANCRKETTHEVRTDRRGREHARCLACFRGSEIREGSRR